MGNPTFSQEVRKAAFEAKHGFCWVHWCQSKAQEAHHRLENTKNNNKNFPIFIQSIFNIFPICHEHHDSGEIYNVRIKPEEAQIYEDWLRKFKNEKRNYG